MQRLTMILAVGALALAGLACSITIPINVTDIKTGPTVTKSLDVANLSDPKAVAYVTLAFGAGELTLASGGGDKLVAGTATYNVSDFEPTVRVNGADVRIEQGNLKVRGVPNFGADNVKNLWDLRLGTSPVNLRITAGAYQGKFDLGGLALDGLYVSDGASSVQVDFAEPNMRTMGSLQYETGASNVQLKGLANARFTDMTFRGGAGTYLLDFSGELASAASVTVEAGLSTVDIVVPRGTHALVTFEGGLSNITTSGSWEQRGGAYEQPGSGPELTISVKMGAGTVHLRTG